MSEKAPPNKDVQITTRIVTGIVFLVATVATGCVLDTAVRAKACYEILASPTIPDMAKAQLIQSAACMALRP